MATPLKIDAELYGPQYEFVVANARFTGLVGGIGSGKTYGGAVKAMQHIRPGSLGLVAAPTYPMLRDATIRTFMSVAGDAVQVFRKGDMVAEMVTGAEVLFRSADNPDRLRGPNLHWAWIDEAAMCHRQTWDIVIGRLRADGKAGPCWITTTPKGRNWLWERRDQIDIFRAATRDNPYLDREFVRSLEQAYTGQFAAQELEGQFVAFEGLIYDEFDRERHVMRRDRGEIVRCLVACDEGYTNPAVALVVGVDSDDRVHVCEEFYQRRVLQDDFVAECVRLKGEYAPEVFYVDPSAAGLIAAMKVAGLHVREADNTVKDGIQAVKARLAFHGDGRPRLTIDPGCANTISEFESYCWAQDKEGMAHDKPLKENDHAMDALRYACRALEKPRGVYFA